MTTPVVKTPTDVVLEQMAEFEGLLRKGLSFFELMKPFVQGQADEITKLTRERDDALALAGTREKEGLRLAGELKTSQDLAKKNGDRVEELERILREYHMAHSSVAGAVATPPVPDAQSTAPGDAILCGTCGKSDADCTCKKTS